VPKRPLDDDRIHPGPEVERGGRVPQVVEPDLPVDGHRPEDDLVLRAPALVLVGVPFAVLALVLPAAVLVPVDDAGAGQGAS
jgi:hypothetical protein